MRLLEQETSSENSRFSAQVRLRIEVHGNIPRMFKPEGRASAMTFSLRKEVIQPQVLLRLPCYDFTPIMSYTLGGYPLAG